MKNHRVCPVEKAGHLDHKFRRWIQHPEKILRPYVQPGMTVLDVGCGPGFFSIDLARMVEASGRVISADVQAGMLDKVHDKVRGTDLEERIVLHHCKPGQLGVEVKLDFILAFYVVHEMPDAAMFFREAAALLKTGGEMLIVEPLFHVSQKAFETTKAAARQAGMVVADAPRLFLSRSALLQMEG